MFRYMPSASKVLAVTLFAAALAIAGSAQSASREDNDACNGEKGNKAIAACTHIIEDANENVFTRAAAHLERGNVYALKGDYDRAIADYSQAIKLDPTYAKAYYNRGLANQRKGNFNRAIADDTAAIRLYPTDAVDAHNSRALADAYNNRGIVYIRIGNRSRGIADLRKAAALGASNAKRALRELGVAR